MRYLILIIATFISLTTFAQRDKRLGAVNLRYYLPFLKADTLKTNLDDAYNASSWNGNTEVPTKNAIRDKLEGMATVLKNTTTWDPGSIGANSSTSTNVTVTGAALGDGVVIAKTSGSFSNGEIYLGYVSAPNTVTIQLQNCSGGTFDITSADFNIFVFKY